MQASKAINLAINDFCGIERCPQFCIAGPSFNGEMCNECFAVQCQDQNAQCAQN